MWSTPRFIIYTNELPNSLTHIKVILFTDDTTLYLNSKHVTELLINHDLNSLAEWFQSKKLNIGKTNYVVFKPNDTLSIPNLNIKIGTEDITEQTVVEFLGVHIDYKLHWHEHILHMKEKLNSSIYALRKVKHILNTKHLLVLYYSLVCPYMDFGITLWGSSHISYVNKIFIMQKKAIRIISGAKYNEHTNEYNEHLKLIKLHDLYRIQVAKYMFSLQKGTLPTPLIKRITYNTDIHHRNTKNVHKGLISRAGMVSICPLL